VRVSVCRFENNATGVRAANVYIEMDDCVCVDNTDRGAAIIDGRASVTDCRFTDNGTGLNFYSELTGVTPSYFTDCTFVHNDRGVDLTFTSALHHFANCRMDSNIVDGLLAYPIGTGALGLVDCLLRDNGGWGIAAVVGVPLEDSVANLTRCEVHGNASGGVYITGYDIDVTDCRIFDNGGDGLRLKRPGQGPIQGIRVIGCTLADNEGAGLWSDLDDVTVERTIAAFNTGPGLEFVSLTVFEVACTDIHGNTGGDWAGIMAEPGIDGNLDIDPLFCNLAGGDIHLQDASPCAPGNHPDGVDCGLIGAAPADCQTSSVPALVATGLLASHPNPFNPQTTISFSLDAAQQVRLAVYNVEGRLVSTGKGVSGTYVVRLESQSGTRTAKVSLVR